MILRVDECPENPKRKRIWILSGSFIAQQLAVTYPEKVNSLVLIAPSCGGKEGITPDPQNPEMGMGMTNKVANGTAVHPQEVKDAISLGLGSGWLKPRPDIL